MLTLLKIPSLSMPDTSRVTCLAEDEPLLDIEAYSMGAIRADMQYKKAHRRGAIDRALVRKSVADRLLRASALLPRGYSLVIFDAWRPYEVQKSLYDEYYNALRVKEENKALSEEALHRLARTFVSYPDKSRRFSFVHASGGAVDLTVADENGIPLDMGTTFDDFSPAAAVDYFEGEERDAAVRDNRRLLYTVMNEAGFTSFPSEWWHYDYGDLFWAALTGEPAKYPSVYEITL